MIDLWGLYTEVITFNPVGQGKSSFGHTAINLNGVIYSFGERGWFTEPFEDYMKRNNFRTATGQVLDLTPDDEAMLKDAFMKDMKRNPKWTAKNNCTVRARTMLDQATLGGFEWQPETSYPEEFRRLLDQMKVVKDFIVYPKVPSPSASGGSSSSP